VITLAAIVARRRKTPGHLLPLKQKITKNGKNKFSNHRFSGKNIPSIMAGTKL
jgi:hypothetical protein